MDLKIEIAEALVVKPGDRVLLLLKDGNGWPQETLDHALNLLKECFPDVTFAFFSGVDRAVVDRDGS